MLTTVLSLLAVLAAACIVLWMLWRAVVAWLGPRFRLMRDAALPRGERREARWGSAAPDPLGWLPVPPDATLLHVESVPISQAGNPAPMLRTGTITGAAHWYHVALSYPEVAEWYVSHLRADDWQEEAGHGQLRVFRRARTLLWLADAEDLDVWRRLTNPAASPTLRDRNATGLALTFTVLVYETGSATTTAGRGLFGGFGRI